MLLVQAPRPAAARAARAFALYLNLNAPDSSAATAQRSQKTVPISSSRLVRYNLTKAGRKQPRWQTGQFKSGHLQGRTMLAARSAEAVSASATARSVLRASVYSPLSTVSA